MTKDEEEKALSRIIRFLDVVRVYAQDFPPFSDYGTDKPMHWKTKEIQELALSLFKGKCASEPVTWGVDWGKAGDIPCVSITKRLPNDVIELVAVEYAPYSYTTPPQRTEQEQQIETLKRCLFQMQEAAKDLVEQAKSLTPPQRTWVGLTDEEREEIALEVPMDAVLITEAKLKDKNT